MSEDSKEKLVYTRDPEILAAIKRNGFYDPIPQSVDNAGGAWVYSWSLEQYKRAVAEGLV